MSDAREIPPERLAHMGEAAKAVAQRDPNLAAELSAVEWLALARMRDRITHQLGGRPGHRLGHGGG